MLTAEHQRIKGADHYAVLLIGRRAGGDEIETAYLVRKSQLERGHALMPDPRDRVKLAELAQMYDEARAVLHDDRRRAAYDPRACRRRARPP